VALTLAAVVAAALHAQAPGGPAPGAPFKLGTFSLQGRTFVGLVLDDDRVVDLSRAGGPAAAFPQTMLDLIARYEMDGLSQRLSALAATARTPAGATADFVHALRSLQIRPPVMYPQTMVNAAVNYTEHGAEMAGRPGTAGIPATPSADAPRSAPGLWMRSAGDRRHNPYLFLKPASAIIAAGEPIRLPPGRDRIDWECELSVVIGRAAAHVPIAQAREYVFGYTLMNDVSDRGDRGDTRHGSDWLVGKGHDTFAPLGPFVVPKAFVPDPQALAIKFTLNGKVMQDSSTARMTHRVEELVHYASNILTLRPGDIIATGSPAGVGAARDVFMKAGDTAVCSVERIGTLANPVHGPGRGGTGD
jgi:2-keto-4-pentenoate hydratase/2-oxohepta-3-ene-1,7-dioic acid hydratase in catechol pathway